MQPVQKRCRGSEGQVHGRGQCRLLNSDNEYVFERSGGGESWKGKDWVTPLVVDGDKDEEEFAFNCPGADESKWCSEED